MGSETDDIKAAVIKSLKKLKSQGKNILQGVYGDSNVQLSVSEYSATQFSVTYCHYSRMWTWILQKEELN